MRAETTAEKLAKLAPAFKADGTTTAGNSSQVSDGAAAVMLMKRSLAAELKLKPLGVVKAYAVVGVEPDVMGVCFTYPVPLPLLSVYWGVWRCLQALVRRLPSPKLCKLLG